LAFLFEADEDEPLRWIRDADFTKARLKVSMDDTAEFGETVSHSFFACHGRGGLWERSSDPGANDDRA